MIESFQAAQSYRALINCRPRQGCNLQGEKRRKSLAHSQRRDLGATFKWVFFGTTNTDTAIFVDAAQNIVKDLDHNMPYFLTGDSAQ